MSDKYQVAYEAYHKRIGSTDFYPTIDGAGDAWVEGFCAAVDALESANAQPVSVAYEFNPRSARQVIVDPATGKKWYIPLVSEEAWREDSTATLEPETSDELNRCCEGGNFGEKHDCMKQPPVEQPPDVSHLRTSDDEEVEIAEPVRRYPLRGEIFADLDFGRVATARIDFTVHEQWILRIKPKTSVYGCDPASISLEGKLSPNSKPVQRVQGEWFREPAQGELALSCGGNVLRFGEGPSCGGLVGDTQRERIIVEEIHEPKRARRFLIEVVPTKDSSHGTGTWRDNTVPIEVTMNGHLTPCFSHRELADLDDPKVMHALGEAWKEGHNTFRQTLANVVRAYLKMEAGK